MTKLVSVKAFYFVLLVSNLNANYDNAIDRLCNSLSFPKSLDPTPKNYASAETQKYHNY